MRYSKRNLLFSLGLSLIAAAVARGEIERIGKARLGDWPAAVKVSQANLLITGQVFPNTADAEFTTQLSSALDNLMRRIKAAGEAKPQDALVKLNVYASDDEMAAKAYELCPKLIPQESRPAITISVLPAPGFGIKVSLDAVAAISGSGGSSDAGSSILPSGDAVYFSGQVGQGELLEGAAQATKEQLGRVDRLGLERSAIKRIRIYVTEIDSSDEVLEVVREQFGSVPLPPTTILQWGHKVPFEIELTVAGRPKPEDLSLDGGEQIAQLNPDWLDSYPTYCRMTWKGAKEMIFFSGLASREDKDPESQVRDVFEQLGQLLDQVGTDFDHLVRAHYLTTEREVLKALGTVRKERYDPDRAPASTLIVVDSVGLDNRRFLMDLTAISKQ